MPKLGLGLGLGSLIGRPSVGGGLPVDYLYIASGVGLSPNINGFRFYDSGLTQNGQPIYYDETNVYWLTYVSSSWIIAPIGTIGQSGLFFKFGSTNPIGLYSGSNGYTGNVTMAAI
jgi:hypothetical protein